MMRNTWIQGEEDDDWYYIGSDGKMLESTAITRGDVRIAFDGDGRARTLYSGGDAEYTDDIDIAISLVPIGGVGALIGKGIFKTGEKIIIKEAIKDAWKHFEVI